MSDQKEQMSNEQRRRKLLAEGALYRFGIMEAREQVRAGLTTTGLAKSAFGRMGRMSGALGASVSSLFSGGGNAGKILQSVTPFLMSAVSLVSKRYVRKSVMYYGIITASILLTRYLVRKSKNAEGPENAAEAEDSSGEQ